MPTVPIAWDPELLAGSGGLLLHPALPPQPGLLRVLWSPALLAAAHGPICVSQCLKLVLVHMRVLPEGRQHLLFLVLTSVPRTNASDRSLRNKQEKV